MHLQGRGGREVGGEKQGREEGGSGAGWAREPK